MGMTTKSVIDMTPGATRGKVVTMWDLQNKPVKSKEKPPRVIKKSIKLSK